MKHYPWRFKLERMKAYMLTFILAWASFATIVMCSTALVIATYSFLFWTIPEDIAYLALLRCVVLGGFVTTLFYMPSKEGKQCVKIAQGIWK